MQAILDICGYGIKEICGAQVGAPRFPGGNDHIQLARLKCETLAANLLHEAAPRIDQCGYHACLDSQAVSKILEQWPNFHNKHRSSLLPGGEGTALTETFCLIHSGGVLSVSRATKLFPMMTTMINQWIRSRLPVSLKQCSWSSFALNRNLLCDWHRDQNYGPSMVFHLGEFEGGQLAVPVEAHVDNTASGPIVSDEQRSRWNQE